MKKLLLLLMMLSLLPVMKLDATPPAAEPGISIAIHALEGQPIYHLDILVLSSEVQKTIYASPQSSYIERFGHIDNIDYLESIEPSWVSYLAHVENPSFESYDEYYVIFASEDDEYSDFSRIILVYFNDDGETLLKEEMELFDLNKQRKVRYGQIDLYIGETIYAENNYRAGSNFTAVFILLALLVVFKAILEYLKYIVPILIILGIVAAVLYRIKRNKTE